MLPVIVNWFLTSDLNNLDSLTNGSNKIFQILKMNKLWNLYIVFRALDWNKFFKIFNNIFDISNFHFQVIISWRDCYGITQSLAKSNSSNLSHGRGHQHCTQGTRSPVGSTWVARESFLHWTLTWSLSSHMWTSLIISNIILTNYKLNNILISKVCLKLVALPIIRYPIRGSQLQKVGDSCHMVSQLFGKKHKRNL